jgi:hypothetical protein
MLRGKQDAHARVRARAQLTTPAPSNRRAVVVRVETCSFNRDGTARITGIGVEQASPLPAARCPPPAARRPRGATE